MNVIYTIKNKIKPTFIYLKKIHSIFIILHEREIDGNLFCCLLLLPSGKVV